jgi:hypothetical protein
MNDYIIDAFTRDGNNTNLEVNNLNVGCITSTNNNFELDSNGNLTVNSITANNIIGQAVANAVYPVGSIYMSINATNPSTLFGGQWEQLKDKFLLGCGDVYQNGATGGEASHTLTTNELPSHNHSASTNSTGGHRHTFKGWWTTKGDGSATYACVARTQQNDPVEYGSFATAGEHSHTVTVNNTGGGVGHNNMPPYLSIYMWKRIS